MRLLAKLLSVRTASQLSGCTPEHLSALCRSGALTGFRFGGSWIIERDSLFAFIAAQESQKYGLPDKLSRARGDEYQRTETSRPSRPVVSPFTTSHSADLPSRFGPVVVTAGSLVLAVLLAGGGVVPSLVSTSLRALEEVSLSIDSVRYSAAAKFAVMEDSRAGNEALNLPVPLRELEGVSAGILDLSFFRVASPNHAPVVAIRLAGPVMAAETATDSRVALSELVRAAADIGKNPEEAKDALLKQSVSGYVGSGTLVLQRTDDALNAYERGVALAGSYAFNTALTLRDAAYGVPGSVVNAQIQLGKHTQDLSSLILDVYKQGIHSWVENSPEWARDITVGTYWIGDTLSRYVGNMIPAGRHVYAHITKELGDHTYIVVSSTAGLVNTEAVTDFALGVAGKTALAMEGASRGEGGERSLAAAGAAFPELGDSALHFANQVIDDVLKRTSQFFAPLLVHEQGGERAATPAEVQAKALSAFENGFRTALTKPKHVSDVVYVGTAVSDREAVQLTAETERFFAGWQEVRDAEGLAALQTYLANQQSPFTATKGSELAIERIALWPGVAKPRGLVLAHTNLHRSVYIAAQRGEVETSVPHEEMGDASDRSQVVALTANIPALLQVRNRAREDSSDVTSTEAKVLPGKFIVTAGLDSVSKPHAAQASNSARDDPAWQGRSPPLLATTGPPTTLS